MLGFVAAVIAGFATPYLQDTVARPVAGALAPHVILEPGELRLLAFMIGMLMAAAVASLLGSGTPFGLMLGGVLGYFGLRLVAAADAGIKGRGKGRGR